MSEEKKAPGSKALSSASMPQRNIDEAIKVAEIIYKNFAGQETPLSTIAQIIGIGEKSTNMGYLMKAAESYGIIDKTKSNSYALSEQGRKF